MLSMPLSFMKRLRSHCDGYIGNVFPFLLFGVFFVLFLFFKSGSNNVAPVGLELTM